MSDLISRQDAMDDSVSRQKVLQCIKESRENIDWGQSEDGDAFLHYSAALYRTIASKECLPSAQPNLQPNLQPTCNQLATDTISRQEAIDEIRAYIEPSNDGTVGGVHYNDGLDMAITILAKLPSAQPEPLSDKEQRIFLAAMSREMKVCEEVDRNYVREPYEDSLVRVCREIERKVKGALWT